MTNKLVRTSITALAALTVSLGALTFSSANATASPAKSHAYIHHVTSPHYGHHTSRRYYKISSYQVVQILYRHGYRNIHNVYYSQGKYYARAHGRYGPVKLVVGAHSGQILSRQRIWHPYRYGQKHYYRYGQSHNGFSWSFSFGR